MPAPLDVLWPVAGQEQHLVAQTPVVALELHQTLFLQTRRQYNRPVVCPQRFRFSGCYGNHPLCCMWNSPKRGLLVVPLARLRVSKPVSLATRGCARTCREVVYLPLRSKQYRAVHQNIKQSLWDVRKVNLGNVIPALGCPKYGHSIRVLYTHNRIETLWASGLRAAALPRQTTLPHKGALYMSWIKVLAHTALMETVFRYRAIHCRP